MGSATFALPSLNRLFERGYEITGVITQPDKPSGRGQTVQSPPVKRRAFDLHLPIYQPSSLKTEETQSLIQALRLDVIVVVAYGKILPPWLLQFPSYGCINVHGSILPKYRGAAPVHWAIANGEKSTGVCTMLLDEGLDTGPLYLCRETLIDPNETTAELYNRLADLGADALIDTLEGVMNSSLKPTPQDNSKATFAPILKKEHGFIDWHMAAVEIHNRVRAFNPWPGTVAKFRGVTCKIVKTAIGESAEAQARQPAAPLQSGFIVVARGSLAVVCGDGALLEIVLIQPENRNVVSGADFANGARIHPDEKFEALLDN
ncbi:MAG: methionyl-tRNA formyltransferase [Acidobacteria bacterium]|nr:MAG: methionyl-tRNA formyltransferase [Acidobacteriota bacterium]